MSYMAAVGGAEHDVVGDDERELRRICLVAATPRSGSNMLGDALRQAGIGVPMEYLELDVAAPALAERWGASDFGDYLRLLLQRRTTANGWFAIKVHWNQLVRFYGSFRGRPYGPGDEADLREVVQTILPAPITWVSIQRRDRDAQAVSLAIASRTGRFADVGGSDATSEGEVPSLTYEDVHRSRLALDQATAGWEQFFFLAGIDPMRVVYEDLVDSYEVTLRDVLDALDLPREEQRISPPITRKQGGQNQAITEEYRRERRRRATPPAAHAQTAPPDPTEAPALAIVGTGRSGTGFISTLLRAAGLRCGHEQWWGPPGLARTAGLDADASWLAVPFLDQHTGAAILQVRDPLATIRSLVGIEFFSNTSAHGVYLAFAREHLPGLTGDDLHDAMLWWVRWNQRAEQHAQAVHRVEDVSAETVVELARLAGKPVDLSAARAALAEVPNTINARRRAQLSWDDLPAGPLRDEVRALAEHYGYDAG